MSNYLPMKKLKMPVCKSAIFGLSFAALLSGCSAIHRSQVDIHQVAKQTDSTQKIYDFRNFPITSLAKMNNATDPFITVYIEGDGYAYVSKSRPSSDPTPKTPVALYLAQKDDSANVVYLGRPCQYAVQSDFKSRCNVRYWTTHRFAGDVVESYNDILDQLKQTNPSARFNLIGFSGGANIAGLLAAKRSDVQSLRTVAGNVDNDFFTAFHKVSDMPYSMNMADAAAALSTVPQVHFIAEDDKFVPADIYQTYRAKLPTVQCAQASIVKGTMHLEGWVDRWPELLSQAPVCQ